MTGKSSCTGRRDSGRTEWLLGLIFVCLAAGIVGAGYFYYRKYEKHYRSEIERRLSSIADLKVGELVQWRRERLADGSMLFRNAAFSSLVRRVIVEKQVDAEAQYQLQILVEKYQTANEYDNVRLLDAQGVTRISVPTDRAPMSSTVSRRIPELLRSGQMAFQDFYRNEHDQRVYLAILVPILAESEASPPLGVLVLRIDPETYLYPLVKRWPTPSLTAETLLVRREGNEVVFLNELRFQKKAALTLRAPLDQKTMPAARALLGQEGVMEGIDYRGAPVVAALRVIPDSPWSLVARIDVAEVYAPLREQLSLVVVLVSALLISAGASMGLLLRQQHVRLYRAEAEEARRMVTVVRDSNDAITIQDFEGRITAWNHGAELMYGYSEAEALAANIDRLTAPGRIAEQKDFIRRLIAGEAITSFETQRVTKDGRVLDVWMTVTKLLDEAGKPVGLASTERDITERKRAEETLKAEKQRLERASAAGNVALWDWDLVSGILEWSSAIDQMLGFGKDMFPRTIQAWDETLHPDDAARIAEALNRHHRGEAPYEIDYRVRRMDGSYIWWHVIGVATRDAAGKAVRMTGSCVDITERKRAEEALRESESRFRQLAESLPQLVWTCQPDGPCDYLNRQWIEFTGVPEARQHGFGWLKQLHPDDHAPTVVAWEAGVASGLDFRMEFRIRRHDGEYRWFDTQVVRLRDAAGHTVKWFGSSTDMTERKQTEEALRTSESMLNEMGRIAEVGGWEMDLITRRARWTKGTYDIVEIGYGDPIPGPDEHLSFYLPEYRPVVEGAMKRLIEDDIALKFEAKLRTTKGNIKWCRALGKAVRKDDVCIRVYGTFQNITERKRAEEKIQQLNAELEQRVRDRTAELEVANKELEAFSYSVSHDLRAPLRAMDGFSMALIEDHADKLDEAARDHLRRIRAGSQQMTGLIDDLLRLSQVARTELRRERVDLTAIAEEIGTELRQLQPDRQVEFVVAPGLAADADAHLLRLALYNLLANAWKFTGKSPKATVEVRMTNGEKDGEGRGASDEKGETITHHPSSITFFVRDNGAGFEMAYVGKLFGAFQRLHSTQEFKGTGIGLAIVQRIIRRHGGNIWAEGAVGQGATFYFTLSSAK